MLDWTEQYRPKKLSDIVGNKKSVRGLFQWADAWKRGKPSKKAVVLSGNPGIGKTSCAYALANQFNWTPIELNTSDARNAARIRSVATAGATHQTFNDDGSFSTTKQGGRKLIILDEADNLYESSKGARSSDSDFSDKGGKRTIVETIRITSQPIILIVNDYYGLIKGSGDALRSLCIHLKFYPPYPTEIYQLLQKILSLEQVHADAQVLEHLSQGCQGDIRAAVRDLQSLCLDKTYVTMDDYRALGNRDHQRIIFDVLRDIFKTKNISTIRSSMFHADEDPNLLLHWITENLPKSYPDPYDTAAAYNALSNADRYLGRTNKRNYYGFWSYATEEMSLGVALSKKSQPQHTTYVFPTWMKHLKKQKMLHASEKALVEKLSKNFHCSTNKISSVYLPILKMIIPKKPLVAEKLAKELRLTDDELKYLGFTDNVKKKLNKRKETKKDSDEITKNNTLNEEKKEEKTNLDEQKQQSLLLDF